MAQLSPQQQPPPQAEPKTEAEDEDLLLADSFFNYDYVPDMSPQHYGIESDSICFGFECDRVQELAEAEAEAESVVNLGDLGLGGGIEEGIEKISLGIGGHGDDDDKGHESESSDESESDGSDDGKEEKRDDGEKSEVEEGEIVQSDDGDYDDSDSDDDRPIRSNNEHEVLPSVPPVNVTLEPHHRMLQVGHIKSVISDQVIVEGVEKHEPLNEGSILWITESRKPLGLIDEIFGPVEKPYYVLRYNSVNEVPKGIHEGTLVSFVAEFATHVLNNKDLYENGYDYDEAASEPEFSDDEKENEYWKRKQRMAKRKNKGKVLPPKESVASTAPAHHHGHCSTISGNGQAPFGARTVAPAAPSNDHGHCSSFSGNGQFPFGARAVAPAVPLHDQGHSLAFSGNGQVHFGATTVAPAAPWHNQGHSLAFSANEQVHFGARIVAPDAPFHFQGQPSTFSGNGQGPFGASTVVPPFPPANGGPNLNTTVWENGAMLPQPQPQPPMLPNGFPTNCIPWFPTNTQISPQLPVPGVPFQQHSNPNQVSGLAISPAQQVYTHGPGIQNQMAFRPSSPFSQLQPPIFPEQQGFPSSELHPGTNPNVAPGSVPFNHQAPHQFQFHAGTSSNHGRRNFHPPGRKGWRPAM